MNDAYEAGKTLAMDTMLTGRPEKHDPHFCWTEVPADYLVLEGLLRSWGVDYTVEMEDEFDDGYNDYMVVHCTCQTCIQRALAHARYIQSEMLKMLEEA